MGNDDPLASQHNQGQDQTSEANAAMRAMAEERHLYDEDERTQAHRLLREALPYAVRTVTLLAQGGETEKMRFDASKYIIERNLGASGKDGDLSGQEGDPLEKLLSKCVAWQEEQNNLIDINVDSGSGSSEED